MWAFLFTMEDEKVNNVHPKFTSFQSFFEFLVELAI